MTIKYIFIGIINTLFYNLIYSIFIFIAIDYKMSVLLATILGVSFSYFTFGKYVFKKSGKIFFIKFFFSYLILYLLNIYFLEMINHSFNQNYYFAGFIASLIIAVLSFLSNKYLVFSEIRVQL